MGDILMERHPLLLGKAAGKGVKQCFSVTSDLEKAQNAHVCGRKAACQRS